MLQKVEFKQPVHNVQVNLGSVFQHIGASCLLIFVYQNKEYQRMHYNCCCTGAEGLFLFFYFRPWLLESIAGYIWRQAFSENCVCISKPLYKNIYKECALSLTVRPGMHRPAHRHETQQHEALSLITHQRCLSFHSSQLFPMPTGTVAALWDRPLPFKGNNKNSLV